MTIPKRGRSGVKANANMSEVKVAHIPKFSLKDLPDEDLIKLQRIADRMRMRKNIDYYVHGKR
jgi:hypothetical protein